MRRQEPTPEFEVEEGAPVGGTRAGRRGSGHDMKGFAKVGRVFVKVHQGAVQRRVRFVYTNGRQVGTTSGEASERDIP
jgi:hypothetical protein